jgi:hypothetical protein
MKQLAIVSQEENDIERKLSDCLEYLENAGVWVYAIHRGQGYAVIWADEHLSDRTTQLLRDAGFDAAPLTYNRSPQIRTPVPPTGVSNQNSHEQAPDQTSPEEIEGAVQRRSNISPREYPGERRNEQENT